MNEACKLVGITKKHRARLSSWKMDMDYKRKRKYDAKYEKLRKVTEALQNKFNDDNLIFKCNKGGVYLERNYE